MAIKLYNTLSRKKEVFKPIKKREVKIYGCGPTVYWYQHVGNMRRYVFEDILKRVFLYNKYKVKHIINITDVGHLTSDTDKGEDKMVKALRRENLPLAKESMLKLADKYTKAFKQDLKKLNIIEADKWPKATEHIKDMIDLIKRIEKNGYTYKSSIGLMFDTSKFKNYGQLSRLEKQKLKAGKRLETKDKKNPADFALWITNQPNHIMQWDSPWGKGFPGWHIECSAMSIKYLGEQFDIHTGGEEHISVHHTNEIAQSESATGKKWVNYWLHMRWLQIKGEKMAKSKGELYLISELEEKEFDPLSFRYLCLLTHYRKPLEFSLKALKKAQEGYNRLRNIISENKNKKVDLKYLEEFKKAINDDLDMPKALAIVWKMIRDKKRPARRTKQLADVMGEVDKVLGLNLLKKEKVAVPKEIKKLIQQREIYRKQGQWEKADEMRQKIKSLGFQLEDTPKGSKVKKV